MAAAAGTARKRIRGRFITFEGGEGTGKSTQAARLAEKLREKGFPVLLTREPGGSPGAEILRHVLLSGAARPLGPLAETILFAAARGDHLDLAIRPALSRGEWVVCDRFADSTRVYQGASGADLAAVLALERAVVEDTRPDLTLVLDVPPAVAAERLAGRGGATDRFEGEGAAFHDKLRDGFLTLVAQEPGRCLLIDAAQPPNAVEAAIWRAIDERLTPPKTSRRRKKAAMPAKA